MMCALNLTCLADTPLAQAGASAGGAVLARSGVPSTLGGAVANTPRTRNHGVAAARLGSGAGAENIDRSSLVEVGNRRGHGHGGEGGDDDSSETHFGFGRIVDEVV